MAEASKPTGWRVALPDPWFHVCLSHAIDTDEMIENFQRLRGNPIIPRSRSPIEAMVDKACGVRRGPSDEDMDAFCQFVYDYVYCFLERPSELPPASVFLGEEPTP